MTRHATPHRQPEAWSRSAQDYEDCFVPLSTKVARAALDALALEPGERLLDVAAGTGAVSLEAARRGASVVAVDFAPGMLALLERKVAAQGLGGVEARVMDAQALDLEDGGFDVAGSSLGVVFCTDLGRALRELHRVLRADGRVFVTVVAATPSPLMGCILQSLLEADPELQVPTVRTRLALSEAELRSELAQAGFHQLNMETLRLAWPIQDPADFWRRWALDGPPLRAATAPIPASTRRRAGEAFVRRVGQAFPQGTAAFPTDILLGTGRR